jgi:hypothetical protein
MNVTYSAQVPDGADEVLIPSGIVTPHGSSTAIEAPGLVELEDCVPLLAEAAALVDELWIVDHVSG